MLNAYLATGSLAAYLRTTTGSDHAMAEPAHHPAELDTTGADERAQRTIRELKDLVQELSGGWRPMVTSGGIYVTWFKTRTNDELNADLAQTLDADDAVTLTEKIHEQQNRQASYTPSAPTAA